MSDPVCPMYAVCCVHRHCAICEDQDMWEPTTEAALVVAHATEKERARCVDHCQRAIAYVQSDKWGKDYIVYATDIVEDIISDIEAGG